VWNHLPFDYNFAGVTLSPFYPHNSFHISNTYTFCPYVVIVHGWINRFHCQIQCRSICILWNKYVRVLRKRPFCLNVLKHLSHEKAPAPWTVSLFLFKSAFLEKILAQTLHWNSIVKMTRNAPYTGFYKPSWPMVSYFTKHYYMRISKWKSVLFIGRDHRKSFLRIRSRR
jgi:hypothetical protein